jgi:hypothetical protein
MHALIMINRSLTYQVQTLMLNQKEELLRQGGFEEDKDATTQVDPKVAHSITEEFLIEFSLGASKPPKEQNYPYLQLLVRAMTNLLILDPEQKQLLSAVKSK